MQSYIIIAGTALHRLKVYKSLDSLLKELVQTAKPSNIKYLSDQIKALKKEEHDTYDRYVEIEYANGYAESLRIQRLPIL